MSDSDLSEPPPSAATLELALRRAVDRIYDQGNAEDLTFKRIRKAAEERLDLEDGFYKSRPTWKDKSKAIIESQIEAHADANNDQLSISPQQLPANSRQTTSSKIARPLPHTKTTKDVLATDPATKKRPRKKETEKDTGPKKRRKSNSSGVEEVTEDEQETISTFSKKSSNNLASRLRPESPQTSSLSEDGNAERNQANEPRSSGPKPNNKLADDAESDMSVVLDEGPNPKSKFKSRLSDTKKPKAKKAESSKGKKVSEQPENPDAEEIKRLQGWLVKCGIRKLWHRELAPYDNPKSKIRHLKGMLTEAGMTGRYSAEKASQIREERELMADLEAVQAGAKQWGKAESEDEGNSNAGKPRRRLARGLQELDFLNDDDGAETD